MGRLFLEYLDDEPGGKFVCATCSCDVSAGTALLWEGVMGANQPAFLFRSAVNLEPHGGPREELLSTGQYTLVDVRCRSCSHVLGWQYIKARNRDQRYKEGSALLQQDALQRVNCDAHGIVPLLERVRTQAEAQASAQAAQALQAQLHAQLRQQLRQMQHAQARRHAHAEAAVQTMGAAPAQPRHALSVQTPGGAAALAAHAADPPAARVGPGASVAHAGALPLHGPAGWAGGELPALAPPPSMAGTLSPPLRSAHELAPLIALSSDEASPPDTPPPMWAEAQLILRAQQQALVAAAGGEARSGEPPAWGPVRRRC